MSVQFFVPGPLPGLNELIAAAKGSGGQGRAYSRLKRQWTETIWALAKRDRLKPFVGRATFRFEWIEKDKRRDPDNIAAGGRKLILDGLVKAGVLKGDGWRFVGIWTDSFKTTLGLYRPGCLVTLSRPDPIIGMETR